MRFERCTMRLNKVASSSCVVCSGGVVLPHSRLSYVGSAGQASVSAHIQPAPPHKFHIRLRLWMKLTSVARQARKGIWFARVASRYGVRSSWADLHGVGRGPHSDLRRGLCSLTQDGICASSSGPPSREAPAVLLPVRSHCGGWQRRTASKHGAREPYRCGGQSWRRGPHSGNACSRLA